jgi:4-coumarate--CoA ligase
MPFKSPHPDLDIPEVNLLTYLCPPGLTLSDDPIWIDSKQPEKSLSPKQLLQWAKRLAFGLEKLDIASGEVIMIYSPNHIFVPVAYLAIVGAGFAFSAANPVYTLPGEYSYSYVYALRLRYLLEIVHQINNTRARVILAHPTMLTTAIAAAEKSGLPKSRVFQISDEENATCSGIKDWRAMIGGVDEGERYSWRKFTPEQSLNTIATINYSSGTTGLPKGVCVSHHNLIANAEQTIYMRFLYKPFDLRNRPAERWIGFLPLYHAYGQLYTMIIALKLHVPVYIMKQFIYRDFLEAIQKFKITHLQVAPPILIMLNKRHETANYDISSVTDILCGAAPLSKELQNDVSARFNVQIVQGWGMTEVTCGAIHVPGGINDRTGSVGQLDPNCECKLLDDEGREVGVGEPGELHIRGPNVCLRYWQNEAATKESISLDKWLRTGDIARYNEKGYFWIVDRKKVRTVNSGLAGVIRR